MSISIILPAYQEAENLRVLLPKINEILVAMEVKFEILIIDTKDPLDDTSKVCKEQDVIYIPRENGDFYGDAIRTGIKYAKNKYIVVMDADGSHNPQDIPRFYNAVQKPYDLIIGSRYTNGGSTDNNIISKCMSKMVNMAYRIVFGLKVKDVSDSYRLYNAEKLKSISLECNNFDLVEEILIKLSIRYPNFKILEVPISFNKRLHGESKRDFIKFVISYLSTMKRLYRIKRKEEKRMKHES